MFVNKDEGQNLLVIRAPEHDANAYHLRVSRPRRGDHLRRRWQQYLAVSLFSGVRAGAKSATVDRLLSTKGWNPAVARAEERRQGLRRVANLIDELGASNSPVVVPAGFGVVYADELRARGITLTPDGKLFDSLRRAKSEEEVSNIEDPGSRRGRLRTRRGYSGGV